MDGDVYFTSLCPTKKLSLQTLTSSRAYMDISSLKRTSADSGSVIVLANFGKCQSQAKFGKCQSQAL